MTTAKSPFRPPVYIDDSGGPTGRQVVAGPICSACQMEIGPEGYVRNPDNGTRWLDGHDAAGCAIAHQRATARAALRRAEGREP